MSTLAEVAFGLDPGAKPRGRGYRCHCPCHNDKNASLDVDEGDAGRVLVICRTGCPQAVVLEAIRARGLTLDGRPGRKPKNRGQVGRWASKGVPKPAVERLPRVRVTARYDYRDEHGTVVYQSERWVPKTFKQRRPDGDGGWIENIDGITPLPYRLPELLASRNQTARLRRAGTTPIYITEGEKDADRLAGYGLIATTNSGGANKEQIWAVIAKWFKDRRVVIVPDNDEAGRRHVRCVGRALTGVAASICVLELHGLPEKGDVSDWFDAGGTIDEFRRLAHEAPLWDSAIEGEEGDTPEEKEITRLAQLSKVSYDRGRIEAAKELKIRVLTLDEMVIVKRAELFPKAADDGEDDDDGQGRRLELADNTPWDEEVEGTDLLDGLDAGLAKYVILTPHQRHALALYAVFDYAFAAFEHNPKIVIKSAAPRSGKTRLMKVLQRLLARPLLVSGINPTALLRVIELYCPSMLLDEFDALVKSNKELGEAMRGLLNSGFDKAGAQYIKLVPTENGWEPRAFSSWCPQVIAGIGDVPETVADRSVQIVMVRKLRTENVARLRARDGADLSILARQAARWAADNMEALEDADPAMPEALNDRAADAWSPLLAIAEVAGGEWKIRAREAAIALSGGEDSESSIPLMLLADVKRVFDRIAKQDNEDRIASEDLVQALTKMRDRPWPEYNRGKGLTQHGLAHLLKPHAVTSANVKFGSRVRKGYHRRQFCEVWVRYLDLDPNELPLDADNAANDDDVVIDAAAPTGTDATADSVAKPTTAKVYSFGEKVVHNIRRRRAQGDDLPARLVRRAPVPGAVD